MQKLSEVPSLNPLTALPFFFQMAFQHIMHIYICTVQRRLSAHYAYIYAHFSLFDVFTEALQAPGRAWNRVVQFWQGVPDFRWSPPQHLTVQFACGKLRLVGEVSPFDSEFTVRGSLTWMRSGTPPKLAEDDFFQGFWQGGGLNFSGVPCSICQSDLLAVNCVW